MDNNWKEIIRKDLFDHYPLSTVVNDILNQTDTYTISEEYQNA